MAPFRTYKWQTRVIAHPMSLIKQVINICDKYLNSIC